MIRTPEISIIMQTLNHVLRAWKNAFNEADGWVPASRRHNPPRRARDSVSNHSINRETQRLRTDGTSEINDRT